MPKRTHEDFLKECPAFGRDAKGNKGLDETTASCQYCLTNDGEMFDACRKECEAEPPESILEAEEEARTSDEFEEEEKAPEPTEPRKKGVTHIIAELLSDGKAKLYKQVLADTIAQTDTTDCHCRYVLSVVTVFGVAAGVMKSKGRGKTRTIQLLLIEKGTSA